MTQLTCDDKLLRRGRVKILLTIQCLFFAIKVCLDSKFNQQFNVYSSLLKFARIPFRRMLAPKTFVESVNNYVFAMKTQLGHDRERV